MALPQSLFLIVLVLVMFFGELPTAAAADCIRWTGDQLLNDKRVQFVFDGTAVEETRLSAYLSRSTVQVHRVWKGPVTQRFVVYGRGYTSEGSQVLERGTRYVVVAVQDAPPDLRDGGVFTVACGVVPHRYARELLRELGRGKAPVR